ncbi:MAG: hypothetical protein LBQ71_02945 [Hungatella sp.]|nr:hypothetical protein [Hungatella sp.]
MSEKYFSELTRILSNNEIEAAPPENNMLPILLNGLPACRVRPSGAMCKFPDDLDTPEANELYHQVAPFSQMVKEYVTEMERAPLLKADALDEDFRLLAEFSGTVLAGRETNYGYMFVTWKKTFDGTGVYHGEYFLDGYTQAKQDFAVRAGLVEKQRLFTNEQLIDIYQSIDDTFEAEYVLSQAEAKQLSDIQLQIEEIIPDIVRQVDDMAEKRIRESPEQCM